MLHHVTHNHRIVQKSVIYVHITFYAGFKFVENFNIFKVLTIVMLDKFMIVLFYVLQS